MIVSTYGYFECSQTFGQVYSTEKAKSSLLYIKNNTPSFQAG